MQVPAADLYARFREHETELRAAMDAVLRGNRYILGPAVERFEQAFADYLSVSYCVGVANGTDAVALALLGLGIGAGDEVICPAMTAPGTALGIMRAGAKPVFADVDEGTRCLDPQSVEQSIGKRTAAIVVVHMHGNVAPVQTLLGIARRHALCLIEDAAQAHGATCEGQKLGTFGDAAAFSFYPTKNLGCLGDAGVVVTSDATVAQRIRRLRNCGWNADRVSIEAGFNSRLDELQAAVLNVLLPWLDHENGRRRVLAERYKRELAGLPLGLPAHGDGAVFHQFAVLSEDRTRFRSWLQAGGIGTDVHYSMGLHQMPAFPKARLPVTDFLAKRLVSLPIQPQVAEMHIDRIIERIRSYEWRQ